MKILMLVEYFPPFDHGGSEQSVIQLNKGLIKDGHTVIVLTPNYGVAPKELWQGIIIERFWFPRLFWDHRSRDRSPFWLSNPLWYLHSFISLMFSTLRNKPDIIHVQSKSFLICALLTKLFFHKKIVVTLRDYQILCPYGLCLTKKRSFTKCSLYYFMLYEQLDYLNEYATGSTNMRRVWLRIAGLYSWCISWLMRSFLWYVNAVVCISLKQREIYHNNYILSSHIIYNMMAKPKKLRKVHNFDILFIGRLTPGKGADLFVQAIRKLQRSFISVKAAMVGEGFLKDRLDNQNVILLGYVSYKQTVSLIYSSKVVVVPSRWEEPFGRVALESLVCGTPVVASNVGGLPEIVQHDRTGLIVEPNSDALVQAIKKVLSRQKLFRKNIKRKQRFFREKFYNRPLSQYEKLYQSIS